MHMEFVTVGKASSDKIHVKYNDKIATFHGEIGIDYFMVLANKIEWYPNKKATINEKIELMTIANKTFLGEKRLYFIADDAIWFDWKGSPLIVIENNIIKSIKVSCVCEVLAEVDEFNDISDFCYLKKYIAELKKAKKLCKKHSINKYDSYGHKKFYYKCTKCRSVWALTEPDGNFNGRLEKL